jgi:hypothetical protein
MMAVTPATERTKASFASQKARRIAANIAKLPVLVTQDLAH